MAESLLSTSAAAEILGVSDETLRRWANEKRIRHVRMPSGQLRFHRSDIEAVVVPVEPEAAAVVVPVEPEAAAS